MEKKFSDLPKCTQEKPPRFINYAQSSETKTTKNQLEIQKRHEEEKFKN